MAGRNCGTIPLHFAAVAAELGYADTRRMNERQVASMSATPLTGVTRIPIVVHVVASDDAYAVSDRQVHEQIARLNEDFRARNADIAGVPEPFRPLVGNPMIEFGLATRDPAGRPTSGIVRKRTTIDKFPLAPVAPDGHRSLMVAQELMLGDTGSIAWPTESYLNIWTCHMDELLGFAAFPGSPAWRDGVVIEYRAFGSSGTAEAPYDLGRTATHEVGHWLDLLHIWGDDDGTCTHSDNVGDTPNQAGSHGSKPDFPSVSCDNAPHGAMFMNYMDYVDDAVMLMFTRGQVARMHATLQSARSGLRVSKGLSTPTVHGNDRSAKQVIAMSAFGREAKRREYVFDGVDWVPAN